MDKGLLNEKLKEISTTYYETNLERNKKKNLIAASHDMSLGGAPLALLSLLQVLGDEYNCFVIAPDDGKLTEEFVKVGISVYIGSTKQFESNIFREVLANADLYICNTILSGFYAGLAKELKTPTIWWIHEEKNYIENFKKYLHPTEYISNNVRAFAVTKKAQEEIQNLLHIPCGVLHLGIEDKKIKVNSTSGSFVENDIAKNDIAKKEICNTSQTISSLLEKNADKIKFFMPANFMYIKGQDILFEAIKRLPSEYREKACFLFAGNFNENEKQQYLLAKHMEEKYLEVNILGAIDRNEVFELNQKVDCLLAPSRIDALPTTVVEGMMCETICLVSDATGMSKYIEHGMNGFVFASENVEELKQNLMDIIDCKLGKDLEKLQRIKINGRNTYEQYFTKDILKKNVEEISQKIRNDVETNVCKRIVLFAGIIDILDIFTYQLRDAYIKMGYEVLVLDNKKATESLVNLLKFAMHKVTAMITFNGVGMNIEIEAGKNIWDQLRIPCINIMMDHPYCYPEVMERTPASGIVLCVDRNHMRYLERFYPEIEINGCLFHGGIEYGEKGIHKKKALKDRTNDVLYVGGLSKNSVPKIMPDFTKYRDFDAKKLCEEAYEYLITNTDKTLEQTIEMLLQKQGLCYEDSMLREIIADLHYVDLLAVSYYREKAVEVIAKAGIKLRLFGTGWENCEWIKLPNVYYGGRISADEAVEEMKNSKIVLNTLTWFKDGAHDRIFNGMLSRAVAVTDSSIYLKEEYGDETKRTREVENQKLVMFELSEIEQLSKKVEFLLKNLDIAQKIADYGYQDALQNHTWLSRAKELENDLFLPLGRLQNKR